MCVRNFLKLLRSPTDVHEDTQLDNDKEPDNDVEIEQAVDLDNPQPKNTRYDKRGFIARKYGK